MVTPYYADAGVTLHHGKSEDVLPTLPDASIDAVVTDPPYELGFMGRAWDSTGIAYSVDLWREVLRVLKPGGHLLSFGGTRTVHRMTCAIEDAGFEIRDSIDWIYATGFPKSLDVARVVDQHRAARGSEPVGAIRAWLDARRRAAGMSLTQVNEAVGGATNGGGLASAWMTNPTSKALPNWEQWQQLKTLFGFGDEMDSEVRRLHSIAGGDDRPVIGQAYRVRRESPVQFTALSDGTFDLRGAASDDGARWKGWGTALKPAREPIVVARRPLVGTVAANVVTYGTGALNVDGCRVTAGQDYRDKCASVVGLDSNRNGDAYGEWTGVREDSAHPAGRWPTNVVLSHAPLLEDGQPVGDACADGCVPGCPVAELDQQSGASTSRATRPRAGRPGAGWRTTATGAEYTDEGGASRFFPVFRYEAKAPTSERPRAADGTAHATVKPLGLKRWLVRLITPPGGTVLDLFAGSGTTGEACVIEGFGCVLIEREARHLPLIEARLSKPLQPALDIFGGAA